MLSDGPLARLPIVDAVPPDLAGPLPTADVADLVAFNFIEDVALKQSLLADGDVRGARRAARSASSHELRPMLDRRVRTS